MIVHENVPIKRFNGFKRVEPIAIDSSAMKEFQKCPRAYFFHYVLSYVPAEEKIWLTWGKAVHKFYESAEINLKKFNNVDMASALAMQAAIQTWGKTKDAPAENKKFAFMNKVNLSNLLVNAAKEWKKEKESGVISVTQSEFPFNHQLSNGVWSSGKMDQLILQSGKRMVRDFKTTSKKWQWYKRELAPSDQFARYTKAAISLTGQSVLGVVADVIICNSEGLKFEREVITYTKEELNAWELAQKHWDDSLKRCRDNDEYPMVERSCNFCDYRDVCTTRSEASQVYMLKSKFKFKVWDNASEEDNG